MSFASNDGSQSILYALKFKKDKIADYFFNRKSKGVFNPKLKPLYTGFLQSIKLSGYIIITKF